MIHALLNRRFKENIRNFTEAGGGVVGHCAASAALGGKIHMRDSPLLESIPGGSVISKILSLEMIGLLPTEATCPWALEDMMEFTSVYSNAIDEDGNLNVTMVEAMKAA